MQKGLFFLLAFAVNTLFLCSNAMDYKGNEFFIMFGNNKGINYGPKIEVTTDENEAVTFWVAYSPNRLSSNVTYTVRSREVVQINLPAELEIDLTRVVSHDYGISIKASNDKKIIVLGLNEEDASTDGFMAFPKIVTKNNQYDYFSVSVEKSNLPFTDNLVGFFEFVVNEDNTMISVTPSVNLNGHFKGARVINRKGRTRTMVYNKGQTVHFTAEEDLSGSHVSSDKPLSFFSGHQCGNVPSNATACDHLVEQIPPSQTWGFKFFLVPIRNRRANRYRILSSQPNSLCNLTCNNQSGEIVLKNTLTFASSGVYKDVYILSGYFCCLQCTRPTLVVQFNLGHSYDEYTLSDPFMIMIPPVGQFSNNFVFPLYQSSIRDTRDFSVEFQPFFNIMVPTGYDLSEFYFDKTAITTSFIPIKCMDGEICGYGAHYRSPAVNGSHKLYHTNANAKFVAIVHAEERENTYGYIAGMNLDSIAVPIYCLKDEELEYQQPQSDPVRFFITRTGVPDAACVNYLVEDLINNVPDLAGECCFDEGERTTECSLTEAPSSMFRIRLNLPEGVCECDSEITTTITIVTVTDEPPTFSFEKETYFVNETDGFVRIGVVKVSGTVTNDITLRVTPKDGSGIVRGAGPAIADEDYSSSTLEVVFTSGGSDIQYVDIPIEDDAIFENTEHLYAHLSLAPGSPGGVIDPNKATIFIEEMKGIEVQFAPTDYIVSEDAGFAILRLVANSTARFPYNVTVTTADGTATDGSDYSGGVYQVTFQPGDKIATLKVPIINDTLVEVNETFSCHLSIPSTVSKAIIVGSEDEATVEIVDNGELSVWFDPTSYRVKENTEFAVLMLVSSIPASVDYTVIVKTEDDSAEDGFDFGGGEYQVVFTAGSTTATVSIPVGVFDDSIAEGNERFFANLVIPMKAANLGVMPGPDVKADITIIDNDVVVVEFDPTMYEVNEDTAEAVLMLVSNIAAESDYTVIVATENGAATGGLDYQSGEYTATFLAGSTTAQVRIPVGKFNDDIAENRENFFANLRVPSTVIGVQEGENNRAIVDIIDNDSLEVQFNPTSYAVNETAGKVTLKLVANRIASFNYSVQVGTRDGTAQDDLDYEGGTYTVTFVAGSDVAQVDIPIFDDLLYEGDLNPENFFATITIPNEFFNKGVTVGDDDEAVVRIFDDEIAPAEQEVSVRFDTCSYIVKEGKDDYAVVRLIAEGDIESDFSVTVLANNGSAIENTDFKRHSFTAVFKMGTNEAFIKIPIIDDNVTETLEKFDLLLQVSESSEVAGIKVGYPNKAEVVVLDDDRVLVSIGEDCYTVRESLTSIPITIVADGSFDYQFTVSLSCQGISATEDEDFIGVEQHVTFEPRGSQSVQKIIPILLDDSLEGPESFKCKITQVADNEITVAKGAKTVAPVVILDDEWLNTLSDCLQSQPWFCRYAFWLSHFDSQCREAGDGDECPVARGAQPLFPSFDDYQ